MCALPCGGRSQCELPGQGCARMVGVVRVRGVSRPVDEVLGPRDVTVFNSVIVRAIIKAVLRSLQSQTAACTESRLVRGVLDLGFKTLTRPGLVSDNAFQALGFLNASFSKEVAVGSTHRPEMRRAKFQAAATVRF